VREDEVIASWEIFTPYVHDGLVIQRTDGLTKHLPCMTSRLLQHIESKDGPQPILYKYGSHGPEEQFEFEKRFGLPVDC